jgi:uncharacterized damage-inducible protein DinB
VGDYVGVAGEGRRADVGGATDVLLERDVEMGLLADLVRDAAQGRGGFLLFEALPGLGKSALLDHGARVAQDAGLLVLRARGHQLEQAFGSGLDVAGLTATVGASTMTLGGMLKHLAYYEDHWFSHRMRGNKRQAMWDDDHWDADPDWEWNSAAQDSPEELHTLWQSAVSRSRDLLSETLADGGLNQPAGRSLPDGRMPSVRWIVVHMIEEYARHNGHADLIRESVDGLVGE